MLLPRRWVVERSFAWATRFPCVARDYERLPETLVRLHFLAFVILLLKRFGTLIASNAYHALKPRCRQKRFLNQQPQRDKAHDDSIPCERLKTMAGDVGHEPAHHQHGADEGCDKSDQD